jgi:hypothetical protein
MFAAVLNTFAAFVEALTLKDIAAALWAPFSIFVGAWMAFYFNSRRTKQERIDKEVTEGNLAISVLAQFYNQQLQYQRDYLAPHKGAPDAWFKIMAGPALDSIQVELNRNDLGFLLQANGSVWQQIALEERRFYLVKSLIDERNALLAKGWAKLEESGIKHGSSLKISELEAILGPVLFQQLQQMGLALIDQVTQNVASSINAISALRAELLRTFPKRKFISIVTGPPPVPREAEATPPVSLAKRKTLVPNPRQGPIGKYLPHEKDD